MTVLNPYPPEKLELLRNKIRIIVKKNDGLYYVDPPKNSNDIFLWSPRVEEVKGLTEATRIKTVHATRNPVIFNPQVDDVLNQIPKKILIEYDIVGFMVNSLSRKINDHYFEAETTLFER